MAHSIDISDLPRPVIDAIETIVRSYREQGQHPAARKPGWARGQLPELPESFFDELPREVLDAFEGNAA